MGKAPKATDKGPKCNRCRNHGILSNLKGHKRHCPYKECDCPACSLISMRRKIMADQGQIRRREEEMRGTGQTEDYHALRRVSTEDTGPAAPLPQLPLMSSSSGYSTSLSHYPPPTTARSPGMLTSQFNCQNQQSYWTNDVTPSYRGLLAPTTPHAPPLPPSLPTSLPSSLSPSLPAPPSLPSPLSSSTLPPPHSHYHHPLYTPLTPSIPHTLDY